MIPNKSSPPGIGKLLVLVGLGSDTDRPGAFAKLMAAAKYDASTEPLRSVVKAFRLHQRVAKGIDVGGIHVETCDWDAVVEYELDSSSTAWPIVRQSTLMSACGERQSFLWVDPVTILGRRQAEGFTRFSLLHRRQGTTRAEFSEYWKNVHGPLVIGETSVLEKLRHYVQNHVVDADGGFATSCDGVVQTTYSTLQDTYQVLSSPAFAERIRADEDEFLDRRELVTFRALPYTLI